MALKAGTEDKKKVYIATALGAVVLILAVWQLGPLLFGGAPAASPPPPAAAPLTATATPAPGPADAAQAAGVPYAHEAIKLPTASALDPTLHPEVMAQAESIVYAGNGRNIFSQDSVAPVHIEQPRAPIRPVETGPPAPPPPPPIDLKFYGYSSAKGTAKQIFLLHGDDIFIAHEGDVVDRRYRVVSIHPFAVEVEDLPFHNTQSIPLTQN